MKLVRFGEPGAEKPGLIDADGAIRDLSGVIADVAGEHLHPDALATLSQTDPKSLPLVAGNAGSDARVAGVGKFICIGLNYADHAA